MISVGARSSMTRKIDGPEMLDEGRARLASFATIERNVVLPHRGSGDCTLRMGATCAASSKCVHKIQSAIAARSSPSQATNRLISPSIVSRSSATSTASARGSGSEMFRARP
jgi:hypothetical protein